MSNVKMPINKDEFHLTCINMHKVDLLIFLPRIIILFNLPDISPLLRIPEIGQNASRDSEIPDDIPRYPPVSFKNKSRFNAMRHYLKTSR